MKFILLTILFISPIALSSDIKEIRWGTEVWTGYTDKDGSGVFTKVIKRIFESQGIKLTIENYPLKRTLYLARNGQLDLAGGIPKDLEKSTLHIQAKHPIVVTRLSAFYHKNTIKKWEGVSSIKYKSIVATHSIGDMLDLKTNDYLEVATRKQTINLVLKGRIDLYIDDEKLLNETVQQYKANFNKDDYKIQTVFAKGWHLISTNNERGKKVIELFDKGMEELARTGELGKLYSESGFITPIIN